MTELTKTLFQDGLFVEVAGNESSFKEDKKYRNWYEGKSLLTVATRFGAKYRTKWLEE